MRKSTLCTLVGSLLLASACGGSDSIGTSPGMGSGTLLVDGRIEYDDGGARVRVSVRRGGADVQNAIVTASSDQGEIALVHTGGDDYEGFFDGWISSGYSIDVQVGDDFLYGSIEAPDPAFVTSPNPAQAFDPQADSDGVIQVEWDGALAQSVRVKSKGFEWGPAADQGGLGIPAVTFVEASQEIEVRRDNSTPLAGGAPGSSLSATIEIKTDVLVANPFPG